MVTKDSKNRETEEGLAKRRREQVVQAAVGLFARQGYYRTTVHDIAKTAGVSPGLIYQYFADKDDILLHSILDVIDGYRTEIPAALQDVQDPLVRFLRAVKTYCSVVDARRDAAVLAYRSTKSLPPQARRLIMDAEIETNELIARCIRECVDAGVFVPMDVEFVTDQFVMLAHSWALKHWRLAPRYTLAEYIQRAFDLYFDAILTPEGRARLGTLDDSTVSGTDNRSR